MTLAIQDHYADPILDDAVGRDVIIDNRDNSNDLEDYQVQIDIDDDQLTLQGERGIRFVDENLQVLDYWEESDLSEWIEVAKIIGNKATAIRMLQKEGLSSASDGDAAFEFFDDFETDAAETLPFNLGTESIRAFPRPGVDVYNRGILSTDYKGNITQPVKQWTYDAGGKVYTVLVDDVDDDGELEVVAFAHTTPNKVICLKWDGSGTKWEHSLPSGEEFHDNAGMGGVIEDIDDDGVKEIVIYTVVSHETNGYIRCLNASSGSEKWNYYCNKGDTTTGSDPNGIQVADIDGDGKMEIIALLDINGEILCLEDDGTLKWSKTEDSEGEYGIAVGDIDNDGELEIVHGTEGNGLRVRSTNGTIEHTFSNPSGIYTSAVPSIKDVDGDGKMEILCGFDDLASGTGKSLVMLEDDCTEKWSKSNLGGFDATPLVLGDIDNDGVDEVIAVNHGPANSAMVMRCFNATSGVEKWTYNFGTITRRYPIAPPVVVDIDSDNHLEILFFCRLDGKLHCISDTGSEKWSIQVSETTPGSRNTLFFSVADLNRGGNVEVVIGSTTGEITCVRQGEGGGGEPFDKWTSTTNAEQTDEEAWGGTYSAKLNLTAGVAGDLIKMWSTKPIILEWASKLHSSGASNGFFWGGNRNGGKYLIGMGASNTYTQVYDGTSHNTDVPVDYDWHKYKIEFSNINTKYYIDDDLKYTTSGEPSLTKWRFYGGHRVSYHDAIRVRKYTSPEPTVVIE